MMRSSSSWSSANARFSCRRFGMALRDLIVPGEMHMDRISWHQLLQHAHACKVCRARVR